MRNSVGLLGAIPKCQRNYCLDGTRLCIDRPTLYLMVVVVLLSGGTHKMTHGVPMRHLYGHDTGWGIKEENRMGVNEMGVYGQNWCKENSTNIKEFFVQ